MDDAHTKYKAARILHPDGTEIDLGYITRLALDKVTAGKKVSPTALLHSWGLQTFTKVTVSHRGTGGRDEGGRRQLFGGSELRANLCGQSIHGSVPSQPEEGGLQSGFSCQNCIHHLGQWPHPLTRLEPPSPPRQALVPHLPLSAPHPESNPKARAVLACLGVIGKEGEWRSDAVRG